MPNLHLVPTDFAQPLGWHSREIKQHGARQQPGGRDFECRCRPEAAVELWSRGDMVGWWGRDETGCRDKGLQGGARHCTVQGRRRRIAPPFAHPLRLGLLRSQGSDRVRCFTNGPYLDFVSTVLSGRQATHPSDDEANYKSASTGAGTSNSYLYHHVGASAQGTSTLISLVAKTIMEHAVDGVQG